MNQPETQTLPDSDTGLGRGAEILRAGGLLAFPTETVYGLGADARNTPAVARIFKAKGRPACNPLIVHVADLEGARAIATLRGDAARLADAFWPGALTLVLPLRESAAISPLISAGLSTVAVRLPANPVALRLLAAFGGPVAAPSANRSGRVSPTCASHVREGLGGRIEAIIDGGPCSVGVESTIIGFADGATLLRPGGIPAEAIEACLGRPLQQPAPTETPTETPTAPGQLASHYAPGARVRLNARTRRAGEVLLGFGNVTEADLNLSPGGDLVEAAANLFQALRQLDARKAPTIAVSPIPETGLGRAINDRLRRAAAPRPQDRNT